MNDVTHFFWNFDPLPWKNHSNVTHFLDFDPPCNIIYTPPSNIYPLAPAARWAHFNSILHKKRVFLSFFWHMRYTFESVPIGNFKNMQFWITHYKQEILIPQFVLFFRGFWVKKVVFSRLFATCAIPLRKSIHSFWEMCEIPSRVYPWGIVEITYIHC